MIAKPTPGILNRSGGMLVFKRRRQDDPQTVARDATPPRLSPPPAPKQPEASSDAPKAAPAQPQPKPGEGSLGVPPFRPAPQKETPVMARTPFTSSPPPSTPPASAIPPQPPSGQSPLSARPAGFGQPSVQSPIRPAPQDRRTLVVGRGISVQGTVQDAERLVVEGTVEATMVQAAELSISQGGLFKGEAQVEEAEIAGTIDGTLTVRGSLVVRGSGRVLGTSRCKRLKVEDGGQITGRIEMVSDSGEWSSGSAPRSEPARTTPEAVG